VEVVADEDVVGARPFDELTVCPLEVRSSFTLPETLLALSAGGHCVKNAVVAELDVEEEKGQVGPREVASGSS
jgi:hypothetical protein